MLFCGGRRCVPIWYSTGVTSIIHVSTVLPMLMYARGFMYQWLSDRSRDVAIFITCMYTIYALIFVG